MKNKIVIAILLLGFVHTTFYSWSQSTTASGNPILYTFDLDESAYNHLMHANQQFEMLNFTEALFELDRAVLEHPTSPIVLLQRAKLKQMLGMDAEAAADYRLARQYNPYAADIFGYNGDKALMRVLNTSPQDAVVNLPLNKRLNYYYDYIDFKYLEGYLETKELDLLTKTIQLKETRTFDQALIVVDSLLQKYPYSAVGHDLKGLIMLELGQNDIALKHFSEAVVLNPEFAIAWYNLSRMERLNGDTKKASMYLQRAIGLQGNLTKAYFDEALINKTNSEDQKAIGNYNRIIEIQGDNYLEAYLNRGLTRKMLGDYKGAIDDINKVMKTYDNNADLYINRGNLYLLFGEDQQAIKDYTKAIELDENISSAYHNRALAYLRINKKTDACNDFNKAYLLGYELSAKMRGQFCE